LPPPAAPGYDRLIVHLSVDARGRPPGVPMSTTPASLLERLRDPSGQAAWEQFVRLYAPLLGRWARRLGLEGPEAAELVRDVFTLLAAKLPHFHPDPRRPFPDWLWAVTVGKARERHRRPAPPAAAGELATLPAADAPEAFDEAEYREDLVRRTLELLRPEFPPAAWQAFWACGAAGRPAAAVAAELGLGVAAVHAARSRVLRRLRRELDGLMDI
jgi:RNA polymerase sigma factor (sigma-70 family)